ncbi:MAG TPA: hypothetical protein PLK40_05530 [Bacteroidaceae bacterium]|nr:hypothetical protein [Bacteroidaceae bacterium]
MSTDKKSASSLKGGQHEHVDHQGQCESNAVHSSNRHKEEKEVLVDKEYDSKENTTEELSVDAIIALEISRNRSALRRTVSQRTKAGASISGRYVSNKQGTPVLEKTHRFAALQLHQIIRIAVSILFLIILATFSWYILLPEVENSPATPYQGMREEAQIKKYAKLFGVNSPSKAEDSDASTNQSQDVFSKSMTLGQNENNVFNANDPFISSSIQNAGTSDNGLIVIPSEEEFDKMNIKQKKSFFQRALLNMKQQVEEGKQREKLRYANDNTAESIDNSSSSDTDTTHVLFDSWADKGKGNYQDLLRMIDHKYKKIEVSKNNPVAYTQHIVKDKHTLDRTTSLNKTKTNVEDSQVKEKSSSNEAVSVEKKKTMSTAIANEMKKVVDTHKTIVSTSIPEKFLKNIEGVLTTHTVKNDETLYSISRLYYKQGKYASYIYEFNKEKIANEDILPVGILLNIPQIKGVAVPDVNLK